MKTLWTKPGTGIFVLREYIWGVWCRLASIIGDGNTRYWIVKLHRDPRTGRRWSSAKSAKEWVTEIMEQQK